MHELKQKLNDIFGAADGGYGVIAPGRVNLIGEHTDYNGGLVLPFAIDRAVRVAARPCAGSRVRIHSVYFGETCEFDLADIRKDDRMKWANYPKGVAHVLASRGLRLTALDAVFDGDIPLGGGLSSSAALEVAFALAYLHAAGLTLDPLDVVRVCQQAENGFVGMNCGIMDQFVVAFARKDFAVKLDCGTLEYEYVPFDLAGHEIAVIDSKTHHELASSGYNDIRRECESAAAKLGVAALCAVGEITPAIAARLSRSELGRLRHATGDSQRVLRMREALTKGDIEAAGRLLLEGHASIRDDYRVSCAELDTLVDLAMASGLALGARMTGAGFGGSVLALVRPGGREKFAAFVSTGFAQKFAKTPDIFFTTPMPGARIV